MKTIIAGSRTVNNYDIVSRYIDRCPWDITEVVSGTARGVDRMGEKWSEKNGISVARFPADWDKHGKSAGFIRNEEMAKYADALMAVRRNKSNGTTHMIETALEYNLQMFVVNL